MQELALYLVTNFEATQHERIYVCDMPPVGTPEIARCVITYIGYGQTCTITDQFVDEIKRVMEKCDVIRVKRITDWLTARIGQSVFFNASDPRFNVQSSLSA